MRWLIVIHKVIKSSFTQLPDFVVYVVDARGHPLRIERIWPLTKWPAVADSADITGGGDEYHSFPLRLFIFSSSSLYPLASAYTIPPSILVCETYIYLLIYIYICTMHMYVSVYALLCWCCAKFIYIWFLLFRRVHKICSFFACVCVYAG